MESEERSILSKARKGDGPRRRKQRFLNETLMDDKPLNLEWADFMLPRLRRCPIDLNEIIWEGDLGGGLDGYVWLVTIPGLGLCALKMFWDVNPPDVSYWAAQLECQNAALLQTIENALGNIVESAPIRVRVEPATRDEAIINLYAFSNDGRQTQLLKNTSGCLEASSMPRMRKLSYYCDMPHLPSAPGLD